MVVGCDEMLGVISAIINVVLSVLSNNDVLQTKAGVWHRVQATHSTEKLLTTFIIALK